MLRMERSASVARHADLTESRWTYVRNAHDIILYYGGGRSRYVRREFGTWERFRYWIIYVLIRKKDYLQSRHQEPCSVRRLCIQPALERPVVAPYNARKISQKMTGCVHSQFDPKS